MKQDFLVQYELCEGKCRLNESVCNSKQKWNHGKCCCQSKEVDDWGSCKSDVWNPSMYECQCNKGCKFNKFLKTKNCSCEKRLFGKLVLTCEVEILNTTETSLDDKKVTSEKTPKKTIALFIALFIGNYKLVIISCHFCQLLLLLDKISIKTKTFITISQH